MSEYQFYEFVALDQPLTRRSIAELRSISSRAEITSTRFWNEYEWGDLKADPAELLARYFDAHLYFANWGTHRFMLRLPAARVNHRALRAYFPGGAATLRKTGRYVVLDVVSDCEDPEDDMSEDGRLGTLVPLRALLLQGDLSVAYLAWLLAVQSEDVPAGAREPPVPAGLAKPSAPVMAFIEFLRVDRDLFRAAAEGSRGSKGHSGRPSVRRTVSELRERAEELRKERERDEALRAARTRARAEAAHRKRLDALDQQGDKPWNRLDKLVDSKEYDEAVRLTTDLRDLAQRNGRSVIFEARLAELRKRHPRRRGYLDAVKRTLSG